MARLSSESLSEYFLSSNYPNGVPFAEAGYAVPEHDMSAGVEVSIHRPTGIKVWRFALDLCTDCEEERTVVYHYTTLKGITNICNSTHKNSELFSSLLDKFSHFGKGIYAAGKDPGAFGSQQAVLLNNYWPRCGDPEQGDSHEANLLKTGGGAGSSPRDPANSKVCNAILNNPNRKRCAEYCVPIIIEKTKVYDIWQRTSPDLVKLGVRLGCNRWGERQWRERDVKVISTSASRLGAPGEAKIDIMARSLALWSELKGVHCPGTLYAQKSLGLLCLAVGRHERAQTNFKARYEGCVVTNGAEDPITVDALADWATSLSALRRDSEAEPKFQQVFEFCVRTHGADDTRTHVALAAWASSLAELGRHREAFTKSEQAAAGLRGNLGKQHPKTLLAFRQMGSCACALGRHREAEQILKPITKGLTEAVGPEHNDTLRALSDLAGCLRALGRLGEAEAIRKQVFDSLEQGLGAEHPETLEALWNWADILSALGRHGEAEPKLQARFEGSQRTFGQEDLRTLRALEDWAASLMVLGRNDDALTRVRMLYGRRRMIQGAEHPDTKETLKTLNSLAPKEEEQSGTAPPETGGLCMSDSVEQMQAQMADLMAMVAELERKKEQGDAQKANFEEWHASMFGKGKGKGKGKPDGKGYAK